MNILYDYQIFAIQEMGGISRYFSELIKRLNNRNDIQVDTSFKFTNNKYLLDLAKPKHYRFLPKIPFRKKNHYQHKVNQYFTHKIFEKGDFDIFHPTYYDPYFLSLLGNKRLVVSVHDMIHEKLPEFFPKQNQLSVNKKRIVEKADRVLTISKQTRDDLIEIFGIDEKKVHVVYLGNSLHQIKEVPFKNEAGLPEKYILFVGWRGKYKNFKKFVNSVAPILKDDRDLHLVCVGGGLFKKSERDFFDELGIRSKTLQVACSDSELKYIYRKAHCFVFPSLYEGFGLPIVEAFGERCPVACSNRGSLPEIAADAAAYFDPEDEAEMRESIRKVIYDNEYRKKLIDKATKRGADFSWQETAKQTQAIYESLL